MNKSLKLMPCLVALGALFLAGCNKGGGGTLSETEKQAINRVMGGAVCTVSGSTSVIPGQASDFEGDNNDYAQVVVKQTVNIEGQKIDVDVEWTYKGYESDIFRFREIDGDLYHKNFEFNFPDVGGADKSVEVVGTPSVAGKKGDPVKFNFNLKPMKLVFPEWSIAEIMKIKDDGTMFTHISNPTKGYFESNQNPEVSQYCYIKTYGEVVYLAPDGNWGLLADGDKFIELYAGSGYNLNKKTYADLSVGEKVYVYGEPTNYQGNIQIGFISKVLKMSDPQRVEGVAGALQVNGDFFNRSQICTDMNRIVKTTGKFVSKSMPNVDSTRGTFVIDVDGKNLTIAYDYHTSKEGSSTLYTEIMDVLNKATAGTTNITVTGTLRWVNNDGAAVVFGNNGYWTIAPYISGHIA